MARFETNLIFCNRRVPVTPSYSVTCDNVRGGREMADHLIDNKHRRMAYMAGPLDALRGERGLAVPGDDSVAGFGNRSIAARV